jgi:hypothetical protein
MSGGSETEHARALALRDAALIVVKRDGTWRDCGSAKLLFAQSDGISVAYRTPFQKLPEESDLTKYHIARLGAQLNLPYGLDVWAPKKVLNIEWDDQGSVALIALRSGAWEADLISAASEKGGTAMTTMSGGAPVLTLRYAQFAVYDGREHMGSIAERRAKFRAFDAAGKSLGTFADRKEAVAAIEAKYRNEARNGSA